MVVFIWVRWMWPRFRYDQLMDWLAALHSGGAGKYIDHRGSALDAGKMILK